MAGILYLPFQMEAAQLLHEQANPISEVGGRRYIRGNFMELGSRGAELQTPFGLALSSCVIRADHGPQQLLHLAVEVR